MKTDIMQIIVLTIHANLSLVGTPEINATTFYPTNSTFKFCEYVKFVDLRRKDSGWEEVIYASDPSVWIKHLKEDGVYAVRMSYVPTEEQKIGKKQFPDRMRVGFVGGGGRWLIETRKPSGSDYWEAQWELGDKSRVDQKQWRTTYIRFASNLPPSEIGAVDLEELKIKLGRNLAAIAEFARKHKQDGFAKDFESGLSRLSSQEPYKGLYATDIAPDHSIPLSAAQLLGATQAAWVFGGMGSWNDIGYDGEDKTRYEQLSEELYQLLNKSIVAAANSSARSMPPIRDSRDDVEAGQGSGHDAEEDFIQAEERYKKALETSESLGNKEGMANIYVKLGAMYWVRGDLVQAEMMYKNALELYEPLKNKEGIAIARAYLGDVYIVRGDLAQAETMHMKALEIYESLESKEGLAYTYASLGNVFMGRGYFAQAEVMYKKTLAVNDALGRKRGMANAYISLANVYRVLGDSMLAKAMDSKFYEVSAEINSAVQAKIK